LETNQLGLETWRKIWFGQDVGWLGSNFCHDRLGRALILFPVYEWDRNDFYPLMRD